jgi:maltooligosyltrehalose trehalohydrolase
VSQDVSNPAAAWPATFGAVPRESGVTFHVWAPEARRLEVMLEPGSRPAGAIALARGANGVWSGTSGAARPGDRYRLRADGDAVWPDPASRFQPEGVHGASEIVDPDTFAWSDDRWRGIPLDDVVLYELHVGTFSPEGTFAGVVDRLTYLVDLGVTAVELMPVAEFPGRWNWGYDGGALFAPSHRYGRPDDLRRLVNACHACGLAVFLDVVYNHLGPDGAYLAALAPVFSAAHDSPWGPSLDFDRADGLLRRFFIENAVHWAREYHVDGLRLDATHAIRDAEDRPFLRELSDAVREACPGRPPLVIAEDSRNLARLVQPKTIGGWGLDGVWSDDLHHELRRHLAGDADGYFADFNGTTADIATTLTRGWFFCGQPAASFGGPRGSDPSGVPLDRFVVCLQNHDQVGNRAFGDRLHHGIQPPAYAAAATLVLLAPETPLLFMGQEWACSSPFQYFTDHTEPLGSQVTEGRRREFRDFAAFRDTAARAGIPDPQDPATFERSRLRWDDIPEPGHAGMLQLHRAALALRRQGRGAGLRFGAAFAPDDHTVVVRYMATSGGLGRVVIACLDEAAHVTIDLPVERIPTAGSWRIVLDTETAAFGDVAQPATVGISPERIVVRFTRPGALVLDCDEEAGA